MTSQVLQLRASGQTQSLWSALSGDVLPLVHLQNFLLKKYLITFCSCFVVSEFFGILSCGLELEESFAGHLSPPALGTALD